MFPFYRLIAFLDKGKFINKVISLYELKDWENKLNVSISISIRVGTTGRYWHKDQNERYLFTRI